MIGTDDLQMALDAIDPAALDYDSWLRVGMACAHEGLPLSAWESWSRRDGARFHEGECARKWAGFRGSASPVTGRTIYRIARDQGNWPPLGWDSDHELYTALDAAHATWSDEDAERWLDLQCSSFAEEIDATDEEIAAQQAAIDALEDALRTKYPPSEHERQSTKDAQRVSFDHLYLSIQDLDKLPPIEEIVSGILDALALFVIGGRGGVYKSFFALCLLACIATGTPFVGREVMRQKVLLVVGEGLYGLSRRRDAWEEANACLIDDDWFHVRTASVNLFRGGPEYDDLLERVRREQYGVIVFDTLQRASAGADANSSRDAGLITERLGEISAASNAAVGIVAHTGKNAEYGIRGSSAFEDDLDIVWRLTCDKDAGNRVTATLAKRRNGPEGLELSFRPMPVPNTESIVLESLERPQSYTHEPSGTREILALLDGDAIPEAGLSASALKEAGHWQGKSQLYKALSWLMRCGYIEKNEEGRYSSYRITVPGRASLTDTGRDLR